jgi:ubiquinone/menaquinone biosynthesis C-methylase UbiE
MASRTTSDKRQTNSPAITPSRQSLWRRHIHPRVLDVVMDTEETRNIRERVCAPLSGEVLEIGFGTGLNLPALPDAVTRVLAVDPLHRSMERAAERVGRSHADVRFVGPDAKRLPLDDASIDTVLCTWSLCSIDDPVAAVAEVARVLRPGGHVHLVEHGLSPDEEVRRWQRRLDRPWSRFAGGCHIDRDIWKILEQGGLQVTSSSTYYTHSEPRFLGWTFEGRATQRSAS